MEKEELYNQKKEDIFAQIVHIWMYRYLRAHPELLLDSIYLEMHNLIREILIEDLRKNLEKKDKDDEELGNLIDSLTDIFIREHPENLDNGKRLVRDMYRKMKKDRRKKGWKREKI